ncbi:MAG TPA: SBBP repeat-containing protein [Candidatus Sulfotelmatobacter sp.]|nr:SBBP repeat-containing protein [Candidatus Sulfotelmatobacter sp.]
MKSNMLMWALLVTMAATVCLNGQNVPPRSPVAGYGRLPLTFESNRGQASPQVDFISRGPGYRAYLTGKGMVLSLRAGEATASSATHKPSNVKRASIQFQLLGSAANPKVVGENQQPGIINYFIGNDPTQWHRNVPIYGQIRYKNVYPGIDLVYYGNHQQLEYDFAVAPKADPRQIRFAITGASSIHVLSDGTLVLGTNNGELHFQPPVIYQERNGRRVPVKGSFKVSEANRIGFQLAQYDSTQPLVIDPVLLYSTYLGGSGNDQPAGIAVDASGNVYVGGSTDSSDFPGSTLGSLPAGTDHAFVAKLDATGSNLIYADYLGGSGGDYGYAIALDASNNVYVTGSTASSDFPMVNPFQGTYPGSFNAFLSKISADGSSLLYSTYFGGNGSDIPSSVAVSQTGEMTIAGYTSSTNLAVANAYQSSASSNQGGVYGNYGFVTRFSPDGSSLEFSTYFGGSANAPLSCGLSTCWPQPDSQIMAMAADSSGNSYVTGYTNTSNFPTTSGAYLTTNTTQMNASVGFISKFNSAGALQYSTYFYGSSGLPMSINAIAVDGAGDAYITGLALSDSTFPVTSTSICDPATAGWACSYSFVSKFDPTGASLLYSTFLGPNNGSVPEAIALDANNDAYVLGFTSSNAFSSVNGIEPYAGGYDLLLVEIDPAATTQLFATYLGGSGDEEPAPTGMVADSSGNVYFTGSTSSTDLPVTSGAFQSTFGGNTDGFVIKVGAPLVPALSLSPLALQFGSQAVGTSSQPQNIVLTNTGTGALSIAAITVSGDFSQTNNCGNSIVAGGSCSVAVTFTPTAGGTRAGSLTIQDNASGSPQSASLSGTGTVVMSDFSITGSVTSATVKAGSTATYILTISGVGGAFNNAIQLNCSGAPSKATCSVSPSSVTPGSKSANVTVTVTTAGSSAGLVEPTKDFHPVYAFLFQLPGFGIFGMFFAGSPRRSKRYSKAIILTLLLIAMLLMVGCAGGTGIAQQQTGTPSGTYTLTVSGVSGSLQHSLPLTLSVQ